MKKSFLVCIAGVLSVLASAQKTYFLYLQTDDLSPFYVRLADKVFSSSTAGYVILSNLTDTTYQIAVGFPKNQAPETRFAVSLNQSDKGYLLKNFADGLSLFDIEDFSVVKSVSANKDNTVYETKTDKFSSVLSKAVGDPGLLMVPVTKKEEPKVEPEKKEPVVTKKEDPKVEAKEAVVVKAADDKKPVEEKPKDSEAGKLTETVDTNSGKKVDPTKTEAALIPDTNLKSEEKPVVSKELPANAGQVADYKLSVVVRRSESSTTEGFGIVYLDKLEDRVDTIRILIPSSKFALDENPQQSSVAEDEKKPEATVSNQKAEAKAPQNETTQKETKAQVEQKPSADKTAQSLSGSSCKELASEKDFMKLRKNMAAKSTDEDMIFEAKKAFKIRCFTTEQVRYLSTLFLTSAAKYQFFDSAYNHVSDKEGFAGLQSEIKDEYYLKRFKALVGE